MIRHRRGDVRFVAVALLVTLAGLLAFIFIPKTRGGAGAATVGFLVLLALKHLGLAALVGGPVSAFLRLKARALFGDKPRTE